MQKYLKEIIDQKIELLEVLRISNYMNQLEEAVHDLADCLMSGGKILLAGNGGSAADA